MQVRSQMAFKTRVVDIIMEPTLALNYYRHTRTVKGIRKGLTQRQVVDSLGEQLDIKPKLNLL